MPFKCNALNWLHILSTIPLGLLSICNILPAVSYMTDISGIPNMEVVIDVMRYMEMTLLIALPPVWLLVWKMSEKFDNRKRKEKHD